MASRGRFLGYFKVSGEHKRISDGLYALNMILNTSQSITERCNMTMEEPHGRISVKIVQNSSKWPLAGDFRLFQGLWGAQKG